MRWVLVLVSLAAACTGAGEPADPLTVTVEQGALHGVADGDVARWQGVPYATAGRWQRPVPPPAWSGVREATAFAPPCAQLADGVVTGAEDCLYLDVDAPLVRPAAALPVIVFIHGGSWIAGDSGAPVYHGAYLPTGDAIVVTINYRLGALGFLALPELGAEDVDASTGNYGLLDQVAALGWVQRNIAAFGGDPGRVLVWGQSAGAYSALMLIASPLGRGLFAGTFSQSGGVATRDLARAHAVGSAYAEQLGCVDPPALPCLRALAPAQVQIAPPIAGATWGPVVDGAVLVEPVLTTIAAGRHAHVPVLIGTTAEEYRYPRALVSPPVASVTTEADYQAAVAQRFGATDAPAILARYPVTAYASPRAAYIAVLDDALRICVARRTARALVAGQDEPVWRYDYSHTDSAGPQAAIGAAHGTDLPFWFHTFVQFTPDAPELALADVMAAAVLELAARGDPDGATTWPRYDAATDPYLLLDEAVVPGAGLHAAACDFWDPLAADGE